MKQGIKPFYTIADLLAYNRILLYPGGSGAEDLLAFFSQNHPEIYEKVVGIGDSDVGKHGHIVQGKSIFSFESLGDLNFDAVIVATIVFSDAIISSLRARFKDTFALFIADNLKEFFLSEAEYSALYQQRKGAALSSSEFALADSLEGAFHCTPLAKDVFLNGHKGASTFSHVRKFNLPESFSGKRVLEVGAFDGFYCFEAEARGAKEVMAVEGPHWMSGGHFERFDATRKLLNSRVRSLVSNLEDLPQQNFEAPFEVTFLFGVHYHLQDPFLGLRIIADLTTETLYLSGHVVDLGVRDLSIYGDRETPYMIFYPGTEWAGDVTNWWGPNRECLVEMLQASGFPSVEVVHYYVAPGSWQGGIFIKASKAS